MSMNEKETENKTGKNADKDIDALSGIETTGHEWDGLKELNNPLPRWWVWIFLITCIWSVWYWVVYPAWPTLSGNTKGTSGRTQYVELRESQAEIIARQQAYLDRFETASFDDIMNDDELYQFAMAGGESAFKDNCATCHGTGGAGFKGYPNLNDDDWLWGGTLPEIYTTLLYGIRSGHEDTHQSLMPAYGQDGLLGKDQIKDVVRYVMALSGGEKAESSENTEGYERGATIFQENCAACHGADGKGMHEFGAPNLTDQIWLYGGDYETLYKTVYYSRAGVMPAWKGRLDDNTIRQLAVYLHQLGGGEDEVEAEAEDTKTETLTPEVPEAQQEVQDAYDDEQQNTEQNEAAEPRAE